MSSTEIKEILYHCECRRYILGTPQFPCFCQECGREHTPFRDFGPGRADCA